MHSRLLQFSLFAISTNCAFAADIGDLTGTSWKLIEIQSMNDSVKTPDNSAKYTLEFMVDGTAAIQADCNRGAGSWASESTSELRFGPIAATHALCPPGSLSEDYLAQFEWVRSYTMQDGHLFLATMADGSIIEFEPFIDKDVIATVLGTDLYASDAAELQDTILARLFDQYATDQNITVETAEIDAFLKKLHGGKEAEGLMDDDNLSKEEAAEVEEFETGMATSIIRQWKINKSLYNKYGGRIVYQQFGPEPLDAFRQFLEERESEGDLVFQNKALADAFWNYFTNEAIHDFMEPGRVNELSGFETPPWE